MKDLNKLTATEASTLLDKKEISSVELTQACLDQIKARNPDVGAWCHLDEDFALSQARLADSSPRKSALHGIPFGVKDVIDTKDFPTEHGSRVHQGRRPTRDALCVTRLRDAGAVLLGKLVSTEYALFTPNETRNPWNLAHTPGGSSSGTGASVADMQVPIALGNQTAGSLIRPAAFCGVFGFKPTHGLVASDGALALQPYTDTLGYTSRSLDDLQSLLGILTESDFSSDEDTGRPLKIGLCKTHQWQHADNNARYVLEDAGRQLANSGVQVESFDFPDTYAELPKTHHVVLWAGIAKSLARDFQESRALMSDGLIANLERAQGIDAETYRREQQFAQECRANINDAFGDFDAIICPSAPGEAPVGMGTGDPIFQVSWSLLGVPTINLPVGFGPKGLPIGIQLVGRRGDDKNVLALAKRLVARLGRIQMAPGR